MDYNVFKSCLSSDHEHPAVEPWIWKIHELALDTQQNPANRGLPWIRSKAEQTQNTSENQQTWLLFCHCANIILNLEILNPRLDYRVGGRWIIPITDTLSSVERTLSDSRSFVSLTETPFSVEGSRQRRKQWLQGIGDRLSMEASVLLLLSLVRHQGIRNKIPAIVS